MRCGHRCPAHQATIVLGGPHQQRDVTKMPGTFGTHSSGTTAEFETTLSIVSCGYTCLE
ncbi:protein of unknown function [Xenorhabdus poinarii G6]|uniref:Uncharacterized protein n=1 Tax=Xenorhabdus poinarii G6 TaxID=1354304 RepID=A0A068R132_9GAMM|nr:protein of unknown function [Xenorhabdus poinarii G6]